MKKMIIIFILGALNLTFANECQRDNNKEVVTCKDTKLMWIDKSDKLVSLKWNAKNSNAIEYCSNLEYLGFDDWRVPNINELISIIDYSNTPKPIEKSFKHFANNDTEDRFYSSTTANTQGKKNIKVFFVEFQKGSTNRSDVENNGGWELGVRCVRSF